MFGCHDCCHAAPSHTTRALSVSFDADACATIELYLLSCKEKTAVCIAVACVPTGGPFQKTSEQRLRVKVDSYLLRSSCCMEKSCTFWAARGLAMHLQGSNFKSGAFSVPVLTAKPGHN